MSGELSYESMRPEVRRLCYLAANGCDSMLCQDEYEVYPKVFDLFTYGSQEEVEIFSKCLIAGNCSRTLCILAIDFREEWRESIEFIDKELGIS